MTQVNSFETAATAYAAKAPRSRTYLTTGKAVRISNNTLLHKLADGSYAIRYHSTDIVTFHANGDITLCSGGWQSVTTVQRMNEHTPSNIRINGKDILSKRADADPRIIVTAYWETAPCGLPIVDVINSSAPLTLSQY